MPTGYQIEDQTARYFMTLQVIDWIDIFSRARYCNIILESLEYYRKNKGLNIHAYVIMTNHLHLIVSSRENNLSDIIRDFKRHTSTSILKSIIHDKESRRVWMFERFALAATKNKRNNEYQFWTHNNHAIHLYSNKFFRQKLAYIHLNPVRAGYVSEPCHWIYSSQRNYEELDSLIEIDLLAIL